MSNIEVEKTIEKLMDLIDNLEYRDQIRYTEKLIYLFEERKTLLAN